MIYELRIYRCLPNRMPALLKRFESATLRIWGKHGIRQAGFWTTVIGESSNDLTYLLAWESLAEREQKWGRLHPRSRVDRRAEREREGRADRRQCGEFDIAADVVLQRALGLKITLAPR